MSRFFITFTFMEVQIKIRPLWLRYLRLPITAYESWVLNKGRGIKHNWMFFWIVAKSATKRFK